MSYASKRIMLMNTRHVDVPIGTLALSIIVRQRFILVRQWLLQAYYQVSLPVYSLVQSQFSVYIC